MTEPELCRICLTEPPYGVGEHVYANWFLTMLDKKLGPPPFAWTQNGQPLKKSSGEPVKQVSVRQRLFLPACKKCNGRLDTILEKPARPYVESLVLNDWQDALSSEQWRLVGRWWAKVLIMLGHRDTTVGDDGLKQADPFSTSRFIDTMPDYTWLLDPGPAPEDVSLFVAPRYIDLGEGPDFELVVPYAVRLPDGSLEQCHHMMVTSHGVGFLLIVHPHVSVTHPQVEAGQAWELLHSPPPDGSRLFDLPAKGHRSVRVRHGRNAVDPGWSIDSSSFSRAVALFGHYGPTE